MFVGPPWRRAQRAPFQSLEANGSREVALSLSLAQIKTLQSEFYSSFLHFDCPPAKAFSPFLPLAWHSRERDVLLKPQRVRLVSLSRGDRDDYKVPGDFTLLKKRYFSNLLKNAALSLAQ